MRFYTALILYRLLLPLLFIVAFPGWVLKMLRRGGRGTPLAERVSYFSKRLDRESSGAVHLHAVSVGESLLAIKLIRQWLIEQPEQRFVLATTTATGFAVAAAAMISNVRVAYSPLDFKWMVRRYLDRFKPSQIVLIEGEVWPHLLLECKRRSIPVRLVNARMSPRSTRRFTYFAEWLRPLYRLLDIVAIQEPADAKIWRLLGISPEKIHLTGSLKFDPNSGERPKFRPEFQAIIDAFGENRSVVLAASTFPNEEVLIAKAIVAAMPNALPVIVPRHAERRSEVQAALEDAGFVVYLRSLLQRELTAKIRHHVLVIDTTGELRDWTAHANLVIIGKSFLSTGGQNPCEAILAGKPLICGAHMENFQPLVSQLIAADACISVKDPANLASAILTTLTPEKARALTASASLVISRHENATRRIIALLMAD